ncbi:hypothetical protein INR49_027926 [Caranx melampygus]|nr:hypothetical protein INR49_027926 [Caranx melampygus]
MHSGFVLDSDGAQRNSIRAWLPLREDRGKGARRTDEHRPERAGLSLHGAVEADIERNNNRSPEEKESAADNGAVSRLDFHGCFERKRHRLTGIIEL